MATPFVQWFSKRLAYIYHTYTIVLRRIAYTIFSQVFLAIDVQIIYIKLFLLILISSYPFPLLCRRLKSLFSFRFRLASMRTLCFGAILIARSYARSSSGVQSSGIQPSLLTASYFAIFVKHQETLHQQSQCYGLKNHNRD